MTRDKAEEIAKSIVTLAQNRDHFEHAIRVMLRRLDCLEADVNMYLIESRSGSFMWINNV